MTKNVRAAGFAAAAMALAAVATIADASAPGNGAASETVYETSLEAPAGENRGGMISLLARHALSKLGNPIVQTAVAAPRQLTLDQLVSAYSTPAVADEEEECLAGAVYFEARGEPIEGQLAVAEVVLNRAASGKYPTTICEVVTQPWQFSFIQNGRFPKADRRSEAWSKAVAIARIAADELAGEVPSDVLWYHADYVAPSWGKRLTRETKIGAHIFYS